MKSVESALTRQMTYQRWLEDIRECNSRPTGMTVAEWCLNNGISKNTYYWRMKALRRECLLKVSEKDISEDYTKPNNTMISRESHNITSRIVPLELPLEEQDSGSARTARIRLGQAIIEINEDMSDSFLRRIMEAAVHAE